MIVSEKLLKWAMRFYPPLFLQGIWVRHVGKGFRQVEVKISKNIFNINYNKSVFGGTIFSAADPFYAVCFYEILRRKGYQVKIWVKSARIDYIKPGYTSLYFSIEIKDEEIGEICRLLDQDEKIVRNFPVEIRNVHNEICAQVESEVYIRKIPF